MGREWYWTRHFKKVTGGDNGDEEDHCNNNFNKKTKMRNHSSTTDADAQVMGCMTGVFQLFNLHQLLFTTRSNGSTTTDGRSNNYGGGVDYIADTIHHRRNSNSSCCRGVEAPRNSLELDAVSDPYNSSSNRNPAVSSDDNDIPFCIQVVVGKSKRRETLGEIMKDRDLANGSNRNVVAKLMGLETLPLRKFAVDDSDVVPARFNKSKRRVRTPLQPRNWNLMEEEEEDLVVGRWGGTRSLPETPRMSCRRSWDSDPRLSVQENRGGNLSASAIQELKCIFEDHVRSPPPALKTEKVKSPIPTTWYAAGEIVKQRKDNVVYRWIEKKKPIKDPPETLRVLEQKQFSSPKKKPLVLPPTQPLPERCENASCRRLNERMKTPPTAIITSPPPRPHPATTTTPRPPIRTHNKNLPPSFFIKSENRLQAMAEKQPVLPEELLYLKRVLERAGIRQHTYIPFAVRWNSPSHPLDPIIFHQLELAHTTVTNSDSKILRHRCNRKLLFDLINETLAETLYPYFTSNPRTDFLRPLTAVGMKRYFDGATLLNEIWLKVQNFPESKCEDQHDIDGLVEFDLSDSNIRRLLNHPSVEEEVEDIFVEIEKSIIDFLLVV